MSADRPEAAARRQISIYCLTAVNHDVPEAHERCRGTGPLYLPGIYAPVLPAEKCDCHCHTTDRSTR